MHKEDPVWSQGEGGHPKPDREAPEETKPADTLILDSSLQNYKKIKFCCLSHPICAIFVWQFWEVSTLYSERDFWEEEAIDPISPST